jgi:hypothetical protein
MNVYTFFKVWAVNKREKFRMIHTYRDVLPNGIQVARVWMLVEGRGSSDEVFRRHGAKKRRKTCPQTKGLAVHLTNTCFYSLRLPEVDYQLDRFTKAKEKQNHVFVLHSEHLRGKKKPNSSESDE